MAPEIKDMTPKHLEMLALAGRDGGTREFEYLVLVQRDLLAEALDLHELGFLSRTTADRGNLQFEESTSFYQITDKGREYLRKILDFAKQNYYE